MCYWGLTKNDLEIRSHEVLDVEFTLFNLHEVTLNWLYAFNAGTSEFGINGNSGTIPTKVSDLFLNDTLVFLLNSDSS